MCIVNVTTYGAKGDGITNNTTSIQQAIDECAQAGGGCVNIPSGRYLSGTIVLHSNVDLHLEGGAVLLSSTDARHYPPMQSDLIDMTALSRHNAKCLIFAQNAKNIALSGSGTIEGQGHAFCLPEMKPGARFLTRKSDSDNPARLIWFINCEQVRVQDLTIHDTFAGWALWFLLCRQIHVTGVTIHADKRLPNTDGIHLTGCKRVSISGCEIDTGDDCIVLRALQALSLGEEMATELVTVSDCVLSSGCQAIRIAWQGCGRISDCAFSNIIIHDTYNAIHCYIPDLSGREFTWFTRRDFEQPITVRRISFSNIIIRNAQHDCIRMEVVGENPGVMEEISFDGIISESGNAPNFAGSAALALKDIRLSRSRFTITGGRAEMVCRHVAGLHLEDVVFNDGPSSVHRV